MEKNIWHLITTLGICFHFIVVFCIEWFIVNYYQCGEGGIIYPSLLLEKTKMNKFGCWFIIILFRVLNIAGTIRLLIRCTFISGKQPIKKVNKQIDTSSKHWVFEKFKGDMAIYAFCPYCNFVYNPSKLNKDMQPEIKGLYNYCPNCGKYIYIEPDKIKIEQNNKRNIAELYKESI